MSGFRLGRLVRLRERQEKEEKLRWAATLQDVFDARERRSTGRATLDQAHRDLASAAGSTIQPSNRVAAEATIDHLIDCKLQQEKDVTEAALKADQAREPYDERRREAETLRALIHAVEGGSLVEGASAFAALRVGGTLLDASHGYEAAPPPQTLAAEAALRFVNSDVEFAPPPLNALLRALNANTPEMRAAWWLRVRGHRRRSRRDWRAAAL